jgi:hypothetical protein
MNRSSHIALRNINREIRLLGILIWIIDTSEALNLSSTCLSINTTLVSLLGVLERRSHMYKVKASVFFNQLACLITRVLERRDRGRDNRRTGFRQFGGDKGDTSNILLAVGAREAEFGGEFVADGFAEEEGDGTSSLLVEGHVQRARDGVFARVLVPGEENGETLFTAGRVGFAEDFNDFGI